MEIIGDWIIGVLRNVKDETYLKKTRESIKEFCVEFPFDQMRTSLRVYITHFNFSSSRTMMVDGTRIVYWYRL